jgi:hypothetical protein
VYRLAVVASVLVTSAASAGPCAMILNKPAVLTPDGTAIESGGGIVVALMMDRGYDPAHDHGEVAAWRLGDGSTPGLRNVAPGLDVAATTGNTTLVDASKQVLVHVAGQPAKANAVLPAPRIGSLVRDAPVNARRPYVSTQATLTGDPPATAVALVVYASDGKTARSWGRVTPNEKAVVVYASGSCTTMIPNTVDSNAGDTVKLGWLDTSGRVGKLAEVKVQGQP